MEEIHSGLPDQNTCNLCGMERLLFEPPPRFCALCFKIINSAGSYYVHVEDGNDKASICGKCHHLSTAKAKYQKRFNYAETDAEPEWVMGFSCLSSYSYFVRISHLLFTCVISVGCV